MPLQAKLERVNFISFSRASASAVPQLQNKTFPLPFRDPISTLNPEVLLAHAIRKLNYQQSPLSPTVPTMPLSRGAIAGIAVGSVLGFLLILSIIGFYIFSRLRKGRSQASYPPPELPGSPLSGPVELYLPPHSIDGQPGAYELVNYGSMQVKGIRNIEDMEPIGGAQGRV
tara:strand:+ start:7475 stop:7987 length:513 start_codon:yes stop_codon:yes gene_type:complete